MERFFRGLEGGEGLEGIEGYKTKKESGTIPNS